MKKSMWFLCFILGLTAVMSISRPDTGSAAGADTSGIASYGTDYLIKDDGSLWVWGDTRSVPTQVQGLNEVQASFPLWNSALVVSKDHSVWRWQTNARTLALDVTPIEGIQGIQEFFSLDSRRIAVTGDGKVFTAVTTPDGVTMTSFSPVSGIENVSAVSGYFEGNEQSNWRRFLFLKTDGTVWTTFNEFASFTPVANLTDIVKLEQNYALRKDGSVWTWPVQNPYEPETLGDAAKVTAVRISALSNVSVLRNNGYTRLAIDGQSRLWFWGSTITGFSDGTMYTNQAVPIRFSGISKVTDAYIVERSITALTSDGKVYTASIDTTRMSPDAPFTLLTSDVQSMKGGGRHIIMQKKDGTLWGWGVNKNAQLGYGTYELNYPAPVPMQKPVAVTLNGESIAFTNGVITRNGQNFIPLRSLFSKMGATVGYSMDKIATITGKAADKTPLSIVIHTVSGATTVNGTSVTLLTPPFVVNGTVYLPLRFISEQLGATVEWLPQEGRIAINLK